MTKKIIISLIVALVLFSIVAVIVFLILQSKSEEGVPFVVPTAEEKIATVTVSENNKELLSAEEQQRIEKLIESVTAPK